MAAPASRAATNAAARRHGPAVTWIRAHPLAAYLASHRRHWVLSQSWLLAQRSAGLTPACSRLSHGRTFRCSVH
jgi:hypothetical protein